MLWVRPAPGSASSSKHEWILVWPICDSVLGTDMCDLSLWSSDEAIYINSGYIYTDLLIELFSFEEIALWGRWELEGRYRLSILDEIEQISEL